MESDKYTAGIGGAKAPAGLRADKYVQQLSMNVAVLTSERDHKAERSADFALWEVETDGIGDYYVFPE